MNHFFVEDTIIPCKYCNEKPMKRITTGWYCLNCGYEIAELNDDMSDKLQAKIIKQMRLSQRLKTSHKT